MSKLIRTFALLVMLALALPGCEKRDAQTGTKPDPHAGHNHDDGHHHDHDDGHAHDHDDHAGHNHAHTAPHGGTLVEIGDHAAHLEFKLNAETGALTMWVLDGEAAKPVRTKQPTVDVTVRLLDAEGADAGVEPVKLTLEQQADDLTGDKAGDSHVYAGAADALKGKSRFEITVAAIEVKGHKAEKLGVMYPSVEKDK